MAHFGRWEDNSGELLLAVCCIFLLSSYTAVAEQPEAGPCSAPSAGLGDESPRSHRKGRSSMRNTPAVDHYLHASLHFTI